MKRVVDKIFSSRLWWVLLIMLMLVINYIAAQFHVRVDLTKEKRYTLSKATADLLKNMDGDVQVDVFLKGDFPAGFRKLANSAEDFLQLLKDKNGSKIHYRFIAPTENIQGATINYGDSLVGLGATPINLTVQKKAGESSNIVFPVALLHYKGKQTLVNLYPGASGRISQEEINSAEALMEYQFATAMDKISRTEQPGIAYSIGNGEPVDGRTFDLRETLNKDYQLGLLDLHKESVIPKNVDLLLMVKPSIPFTENEKIAIDQFVMRGGKLLCFIDKLYAEQDSLALKPQTVAFDRNLELTDIFFRYGTRINTDLLMDLQCDMIPFVVGGNNQNPQYEFLHWNYFPFLLPAPNQSISKNLGYVVGKFVNSMDTIAVEAVKKTALLVSSSNSRTISTPALISLNENKNAPEDAMFKRNAVPVAMLLEGNFTSFYKNRASKAMMDSLAAYGQPFNSRSKENKMIIVADGDMVLNDFMPNPDNPGSQPIPLPMGWNRYSYAEYARQTENGRLFVPVANREFFLNAVEYLVNNPSISQTRNKEIVLRLLDSKKVNEQKTTWQFLNIGLPILLVIIFGWFYQYLRKKKYAAA